MSLAWQLVCAVGLAALGVGCREVQPLASASGGALPLAPLASTPRAEPWLGGPEAPSGKLRSGVVTYYRFASHPPDPVTVILRWEEALADDATAEVSLSDGARFADPQQATRWRLTPNRVSELSLTVIPDPLQPSYLNVFTAQAGRHSARSMVLPSDRRGSAVPEAEGSPRLNRRGLPAGQASGGAH